jgi:hypothetical protein
MTRQILMHFLAVKSPKTLAQLFTVYTQSLIQKHTTLYDVSYHSGSAYWREGRYRL